ncbi:hypothetical protein ODZ83_05445 [Acaricomes phytoseiuli]|uniref:hypothetical protein n=1 Tax=Acaricomes phytoseiuli TaxID=291968 RepID=UPI002221C445|nr:hypothetical protein [Acaricomes phytoseiuli]MCW1249635.1 hypothetical protein [Acaricomes phytoseiuli]
MSKPSPASVMVARIVHDRAKQILDAHKEALRGSMAPEDRLTARIGDVKLGAVSRAKESQKFQVSSESALLAWVKENHPEWLKQTIAPWALNSLLAAANDAGAPVDPLTGEEVPGIEARHTGGYVTVRPVENAAQIITDLLTRGELSLQETLELET